MNGWTNLQTGTEIDLDFMSVYSSIFLQTCCGSIERRKLTRSLQLQRSRPNQLAPIAASLTQITKMSYAG